MPMIHSTIDGGVIFVARGVEWVASPQFSLTILRRLSSTIETCSAACYSDLWVRLWGAPQ